jgi:hypothetical protein
VALKSELMASGMSAALAQKLGWDPPTNFSAAGSSQTTATLLTANHAVINGGSGGVIIGDAVQMWFVQNGLGGNLVVYPPVGDNFSGLSVNTGITVPTTKALSIEPGGPTGITWGVSA